MKSKVAKRDSVYEVEVCLQDESLVFRLEIFKETKGGYYARLFKSEFYRIQPSFPQSKGLCISSLADESFFVDASHLVDATYLKSRSSKRQLVQKLVSALEKLFTK